MGGGNSFYAARYGLACDNVLRFEVVLADGSIVTASADEHPDLFHALEGSSNNPGIVTRFDLAAFDNGEHGTIFSGVVLYPARDTSDQQFQALVDFSNNIPNDPFASVIIISTFSSGSKTPLFMNAYEYTKAGSERVDAGSAFKDFWAIPGNISDSTGPRNMTSLVHEFEISKDHRVSFSTVTFDNDVRVLKKAHEAFLHVAEALTADAEGEYGKTLEFHNKQETSNTRLILLLCSPDLYSLYQPIPILFAKHGLERGGNVLGLDRFNNSLIMWESYLRWVRE